VLRCPPRCDDLPSWLVKKMSIDEMLWHHCGELGRWHLRHFVLTSLSWVLVGFHTMVIIFADHEPHWNCHAGSLGFDCNAAATSICELKPCSWEWVGGTTVSDWGLICGDKFKVGLVRAVFFVGWTIGLLIFSYLCLKFVIFQSSQCA